MHPMNHKVQVFDNHATFVCPRCENTKTVNVAEYKKVNKKVSVLCKCPCGHSYTALLERRNYERKPTVLPGVYSRSVSGLGVEKGQIVVVELSRSGLKFKPRDTTGLKIGDKLTVFFNLNDDAQSLIKKKTVIMNINEGMHVGTEFCSTEPYGKIGAFLFG